MAALVAGEFGIHTAALIMLSLLLAYSMLGYDWQARRSATEAVRAIAGACFLCALTIDMWRGSTHGSYPALALEAAVGIALLTSLSVAPPTGNFTLVVVYWVLCTSVVSQLRNVDVLLTAGFVHLEQLRAVINRHVGGSGIGVLLAPLSILFYVGIRACTEIKGAVVRSGAIAFLVLLYTEQVLLSFSRTWYLASILCGAAAVVAVGTWGRNSFAGYKVTMQVVGLLSLGLVAAHVGCTAGRIVLKGALSALVQQSHPSEQESVAGRLSLQRRALQAPGQQHAVLFGVGVEKARKKLNEARGEGLAITQTGSLGSQIYLEHGVLGSLSLLVGLLTYAADLARACRRQSPGLTLLLIVTSMQVIIANLFSASLVSSWANVVALLVLLGGVKSASMDTSRGRLFNTSFNSVSVA